MLPDVLQKVQGYAVRHVVFSVAQTVKLMQVSKMFQAVMLPNVLMHLANRTEIEILSEQNQIDVAVVAVAHTATVAVVAKKKLPCFLHADKHFVFPRHFSSECCNEIKRSSSTTMRTLDGTPRPKMKCPKCTKTHKKWIVLPEYRVSLCLPQLLEPISKLKLTPSDEYSLRHRLQVFTQQE